jgi:hypothetical protein
MINVHGIFDIECRLPITRANSFENAMLWGSFQIFFWLCQLYFFSLHGISPLKLNSSLCSSSLYMIIEKGGIIEYLLGPAVVIPMDTTLLWLVDPISHPPLFLASPNHSMVVSIGRTTAGPSKYSIIPPFSMLKTFRLSRGKRYTGGISNNQTKCSAK